MLTDTILSCTVSGVADTVHTLTKRKHSPRYGINFLDSQASPPQLTDSGKLKIFPHLQKPNTHPTRLSVPDISIRLRRMAQMDELW